VQFPKIGRYLSSDNDIQAAVLKALEIQAIARLCDQFLPQGLAAEVHPASLKDGKLVILATHSAAAAKLRLLSESLANFLLKQGAKVKSVSVKVQPTTSRKRDGAPHKSIQFSPSALSELTALHDRLGNSPARGVLEAILARHGAKKVTASPAGARREKASGSGRRRKGST
jgi:hypothetical protein